MPLEQSILTSTKKTLGVAADDPSFDHDVITFINAAFSHLQQLGVGPEIGFQIDGAEEEWGDFIVDAPKYVMNAVKVNVHLRVRTLFDPPQTTHLAAAMDRQLLESDVRLSQMREATEWVNPDPRLTEEDLIDEGLIPPAPSMVIDGGDPTGA